MRKNRIYCACTYSSKRRDQSVVVIRRREETRQVRCTARRTQASEPTLNAFGLAAERRTECAKVNLSWYFVFYDVNYYCC